MSMDAWPRTLTWLFIWLPLYGLSTMSRMPHSLADRFHARPAWIRSCELSVTDLLLTQRSNKPTHCNMSFSLSPALLRTVCFLAPTLSLTTSASILGYSFFISPLVISTASRSPSDGLAQLRPFFEGGKYVFPPLSIVCTALWGTLAYALPRYRTPFSIAAAGAFAIIPFTSLYMIPFTNNRILELDDAAKKGDKSVDARRGEVKGLMESFAKQNIVRGGMFWVGGLVGLWAML